MRWVLFVDRLPLDVRSVRGKNWIELSDDNSMSWRYCVTWHARIKCA